MAVQTETLQVTGIRCERCVGRLAATLKDQPGLEQANANLMGQVTLAWDDEQTSRDDLLAAMARGGFRPAERFERVSRTRVLCSLHSGASIGRWGNSRFPQTPSTVPRQAASPPGIPPGFPAFSLARVAE